MLILCQSGLFFCKWGRICQHLCLWCKLFLRVFQVSHRFRIGREKTPFYQHMIELLVWGVSLTSARSSGDLRAQIWCNCKGASCREGWEQTWEPSLGEGHWMASILSLDHLLCWPNLLPWHQCSESSSCTTANREVCLVCRAYEYLFAPVLWLSFLKGIENSKALQDERETFFEVVQAPCQTLWRFLAALSQVVFEAGANGSTRARFLLWEGALSFSPQQILLYSLNPNVVAGHTH